MRKLMACVLVVSLACPVWAGDGEEKKKAKKGALLGGLFGAIGAIAKGKSPEQVVGAALKGAAIGAAIGYTVGKIETRVRASRAEAQQRAGVPAGQTYFRVEQVTVEPESVAAGGTAHLVVQYTAIPAYDWEAAAVRVRPVLYYQGEALQDLQEQGLEAQNGGGSYETRLPITFPANAPEGTYTLASDWSGMGQSASTRSVIIVRAS
ncbi:MAG: hypothetical protein KJ067_04170 [Vicinamibacteria bacterium]|nr:hypothetical protein [Vicinamibacteria bacterium]